MVAFDLLSKVIGNCGNEISGTIFKCRLAICGQLRVRDNFAPIALPPTQFGAALVLASLNMESE
jgi:hypothetical protein